MFNFCLLSGLVVSRPLVRFYQEELPVTKFFLDIHVSAYAGGRIEVTCLGKMALDSAKYLHIGTGIAVAGFISRGIDRPANATSMTDLGLTASELEVLSDGPFIGKKTSRLEQQS
jgi:primosomal replication protein N